MQSHIAAPIVRQAHVIADDEFAGITRQATRLQIIRVASPGMKAVSPGPIDDLGAGNGLAVGRPKGTPNRHEK